jgi:hypothetical protein
MNLIDLEAFVSLVDHGSIVAAVAHNIQFGIATGIRDTRWPGRLEQF